MGKSTDYKKLYELICSGEAVPAFVDHLYNKDKSDLCRDVCQVVRRGEFDINIFARGIGYGAIYPFDAEHGSEFELFARECASLNLEFEFEELLPPITQYTVSAIEAIDAVPASDDEHVGWQLVPIEPTWEMQNHASEVTDVNSFLDLQAVYKAMLKAAIKTRFETRIRSAINEL